jgi:hypothetical protein
VHGRRVHAVAEARGGWSVVENVPQVGIAFATGDCGAIHTERLITNLDDVLLGNRFPKAGPASSRVELGVGAKEGVVATDATEDSVIVEIPRAAGVGSLGRGLPSYRVGDGGELLTPFGVGLDHTRDGDLASGLAVGSKLNDGDGARSAIACVRFHAGERWPLQEPEGCRAACAGGGDDEGAPAGTMRGGRVSESWNLRAVIGRGVHVGASFDLTSARAKGFSRR